MSENKELLEQTKTAIAKIERALAIHQFKRMLDKVGLGDGTTRKPKAIATEPMHVIHGGITDLSEEFSESMRPIGPGRYEAIPNPGKGGGVDQRSDKTWHDQSSNRARKVDV